LQDGICWWLLKPSTQVQQLIERNVVTVTDVLAMDAEQTSFFWEPLGRSFSKVLAEYYGDSAVLRKYSSAWTIIFRTPGMDVALETPTGSRLATQSTKSHISFTLPRLPRKQENPPIPKSQQLKPLSPRRSPRKSLERNKIPTTPTKRSGNACTFLARYKGRT